MHLGRKKLEAGIFVMHPTNQGPPRHQTLRSHLGMRLSTATVYFDSECFEREHKVNERRKSHLTRDSVGLTLGACVGSLLSARALLQFKVWHL